MHHLGAVGGPEEVPQERGGPGVHVRAPFHEQDDVRLVDELPDRPEEDRGEWNDLEVRSLPDVAPQVRRVQGRDGDVEILPQHRSKVLDVGAQ